MKAIFLGTSCMQPTKERNQPGILLQHYGSASLFDCGEGIQRQMKIKGLKNTKIDAIFITHWHGDHTFGLVGLLQSMKANGYNKTLTLVGPVGTKKRIKQIKAGYAIKDSLSFKIIEAKKGICYDTNKYFVECEEMKHTTPCLGFRLVEKDKIKIKPSIIKKIGQSPLLGQLQKGKNIEFEGKKIQSKQAIKIQKGKVFTYITDTLICKGITKLSKKSDLLVIESTFSSKEKEKAKIYHHLTSEDCGKIANKAKAKQLVLTHFSQRYKTTKNLVKEAKKHFKKVKGANDFDEYLI